jgi:hypothetical protein
VIDEKTAVRIRAAIGLLTQEVAQAVRDVECEE